MLICIIKFVIFQDTQSNANCRRHHPRTTIHMEEPNNPLHQQHRITINHRRQKAKPPAGTRNTTRINCMVSFLPDTYYIWGLTIGRLGSQNRPFPLESCYLNKDGFMCCNKELEKLMDQTYLDLSKSRDGHWKKCNYHQVSQRLVTLFLEIFRKILQNCLTRREHNSRT